MNFFGADTVGGFQAAADARFREANRLSAEGHTLAAAYLYGYVAEMVIKAAAFRALGFGPSDPISKSDRKFVEDDAKLLGYFFRNPHDPLPWASWLDSNRQLLSGSPYNPVFAGEMYRRIDDIHLFWSPDIRYHDDNAAFGAGHLADIRDAARWMLVNASAF